MIATKASRDTIDNWKEIFQQRLNIRIVVVDPDTDDYELLLEIGAITSHLKGAINNGSKIIVVRRESDQQALKTLVHEVSHVLYQRGLLKKAVKGYKPSKKWLMNYPPEQRTEEATVESVAMWATDSFEGFNPEFLEWLNRRLL